MKNLKTAYEIKDIQTTFEMLSAKLEYDQSLMDFSMEDDFYIPSGFIWERFSFYRCKQSIYIFTDAKIKIYFKNALTKTLKFINFVYIGNVYQPKKNTQN